MANEKGSPQGFGIRSRGPVAPLIQLPFGTAAAVSARRGELQVDVSVRTLFEGGPDAGQDTRFNVASVSKLLTAARVVSLANQGNLSLEDPVTDHLPASTSSASTATRRCPS
jgi:CubicO group peptidase (beta-lactamase class C family)